MEKPKTPLIASAAHVVNRYQPLMHIGVRLVSGMNRFEIDLLLKPIGEFTPGKHLGPRRPFIDMTNHVAAARSQKSTVVG